MLLYIGIGTDVLSTVYNATKQLQKHCINSRFSTSVDEWPPHQPKHYTTLAFIHNKDKRTDTVRFSVSEELAVAGKIDTSQLYKHTDLNASMTKNISDIFLPAESSNRSFVDLHVLIEGAPGIGKTVLTKEIAYLWAKKELLISKNLLLLVFLRECHQKPLRSIESLVQHVFKSSEMTAHLASYLSQTDGKDAIFIFDGYDELSEENKKESVIVDIICRRILTKCCLVITSRPTASSHLHSIVDCRVEIVGFTEEDRLDYIQTALKDCDEQVKALQHYLQSNPTINALCYIPLNMTILLCLVDNVIDRLPKTQTEMYKKFIEMTIVRFIKKYENCNTVINVSELAHPYDKLFIDLAKLAYEALKTDKIVFTLDEIKAGCPHLTTTSSNWNGLGLLKAVQYFSPETGNDQVTFHFLHFSVQEYMAAWYISSLSDRKQIKLLNKTFWELRYYNTWIMYVGITCGTSFALRHFLSGNWFQLYSKLFKNSKVSNKYLKHKMKCLHLFQCLVEASKEGTIESMKQLFQNNQIDLSNQTLLPSDLNTLGFFLIRSINKEWNVLNLSNCNIGEIGSNILCDRFLDKDARSIVTIKLVNFSYNQLKFSSLIKLFDLFNSWHTSEIIITDIAILDNMTDIEEIENIVLQSSILTLVYIGTYLFSRNLKLSRLLHGHVFSYTTNIRSIYLLNCTSDSETIELLTLLEKQKLNKVRIIGLTLDKLFIKTMASLLLNNNDSVNMFVYDPNMSDEIADDISSLISSFNKDISGVMLIVSSSKIQGFVNTCTLSNELSALELFNLSIYIRYLNTDVCSWKNNLEFHNKKIIYSFLELLYKIDFNWKLKIALQENDTLILHKGTFKSLNHSIHFSESTSVVYLSYYHDIDEFECNVMSENCSTLHIFNSPDYVKFLRGRLLHKQSVPNELFIYGNIKYSLINSLIEMWSYRNCNISAVLVANDLIVAHHPNTWQIALAFQLQPLLTTLILSTTNNVSVFYQVIDIVTLVNTRWSELDLAGCDISASEYEIMYRTIRYSTVRKLNISFNKLSVLGIPYLVKTVLTWGVKKLNINGTNDVLYDCLIENLLSGSKNELNFFISVTYNNKTIYIVCNTSQNKIIMKANSLVSELYIINCELQFISTEIISYLNTMCNLWRLCVSSTTVSETFVMEILKLFSNKAIELTISNVKIIGDDRMIWNLITSKKFYCYILSLVISTDHYLCVYNIRKYQLHLIHRYFMNKTREDCNGMALIRKLMKINGDKLFIFEEGLVKLISLFGKVPQAAADTQIIAALSNATSLKTVEIDNYCFTCKMADNLINILHCNTQLQELSINRNDLQPSNVIKIAKALCGGIRVCNKSNINTDDSINHFSADIATPQCNNNLTGTIVMTETMSLPNLVTLTKLSISNNNITDEAADDIAAALFCNIHLQELNLSHNDLQASGAIKIARSLQKVSSLINLYIDHNNISHEAADDIAAAISSNVCLQELNLGGNRLQALGAIKVGKGLQNIVTLTKLYMHDNNITHNAADDIAAVISCNDQIEELNISRNDLQVVGIKKIAKKLQCICTLKKLHINNNNINDEAADDIAAAVSYNNVLQEIDISENNFQTTGIIKIAKALQKISSLKNLCLRNIGITYEAAVHIGQIFKCNANLQQLDINKNNFKSSGAIKITAVLHCITTLTKLYLSNNNISSVASGCIAAAISCNICLQEFDISVNNLKTSGAVKITKALQTISTLTKLYINDNNVTHEAADDIAAAISCNIRLQEFDIGRNKLKAMGATKIAKALQNISTLTKLCINSMNICHEAVVTAISCSIHLQEFDIGRNNLQAVGAIKIAKRLQNISTLTKLYINHNNITDEAADDIATAISCNTHLQEFDISVNNLKTSGTVKIAKALQTISTLTKLYINDNNITHEAADDIAAAISCNICLQEIDIGKNNLQAVGAIKIAKCLQNISTLTKLYINHNNITDVAADHIGSAICSNIHLQEFDISGNNLTINVVKIAKGLQNTSTLTKLCIYDDNITKEAATDIATAISFNSYLKQLDIRINKLCGLGTVIISKALQTISTLTKLYMDNNKITDEAADDIAAAIASNNHLEEFSIGANHLRTSGAIIVAKGLQNISTLTKLYINNNKITDEAADDIAGVILCNSNLKEFDIGKNYLRSSGAIKIARSLQKISSLTKLHIDHNYITDEAIVDIAAIICFNPGVKVRVYGNIFCETAAIKFCFARYRIISRNPLGNINYLTASNAVSDTDSDTVADYLVPNTDLETDTVPGYSVPDMELDTESPYVTIKHEISINNDDTESPYITIIYEESTDSDDYSS